MSDNWTPSTEQVRSGYAIDPEDEYRNPINAAGNRHFLEGAFDRWLAARDRENRAIGWDEGVTAAHDRLAKRVDTEGLIDQHALIKRPVNPYRGDNR